MKMDDNHFIKNLHKNADFHMKKIIEFLKEKKNIDLNINADCMEEFQKLDLLSKWNAIGSVYHSQNNNKETEFSGNIALSLLTIFEQLPELDASQKQAEKFWCSLGERCECEKCSGLRNNPCIRTY